ncbi:WAT1-related protein At1g68170-like [Mangifera indica]|uniref:WAT1-related protein At1g68170-like n=1 Tax=Mangifera indica TaxID=29780 RepID=UPI001CF9AA41|nr:WAT1-related protein At1g68170-like [Mangifera indica]
MMDEIGNFIHRLKPALIMVVVQVAYGGVNVLYKLAANDGMSLSVIVAYRFIFATVFMVPLALILERNSRPKLTWRILFQAFLCSLIGGSLHQHLYLTGLAFTTATFATAMNNLIPAITFFLAFSFGLEKVGIKTLAGKAKVFGTLIGIGGAMLLTFYKGVEIKIWSTNINVLHNAATHHTESNKFLLGCLLVLASCFTYSSWLIIQAKMSEQYPCHYSTTALVSLMAAIESVVFAFFREKDWNQWKLGFNIRLLTVAYAGIVSSGLLMTLIFWCVRTMGPLFVSSFSPLMLVVVAFLGSLILNETLHVGSILGSTLIVCGLYAVLWGKGKEMKKITRLVPTESSAESQTIDITEFVSSKSSGESQSTEIVIDSPVDFSSNKSKCNSSIN